MDFRLYAPIAIIYYAQVSGSYMLAMMVFSVAGLASTFFELPTGLLSDRIGRKLTLTAGAVAGTVAVALYAASPGIKLLLTGAVFEGLSGAFYSGNNSALLYDTLKSEGLEKDFHDYTGKVSSFFQIALALSALAGGAIAQYSFRMVLIISVFFQAAIIPLSLLLTEPPGSGKNDDTPWDTIKNALVLFKNNRELRRVSLANLISYAGGESAYQFQSAFIGTLWPIWAIGLARTISNGGAALSFWFSGRIIRRFGEIKMLIASKVYSRTVYLTALLFPSLLSPVLMTSSSLFFGVSCVAEESFNHSHFSNKERATMGSIISFIGQLIYGIYSPLLGLAADIMGPGKAMILSQLIMIIPIIMLIAKEKGAVQVHR